MQLRNYSILSTNQASKLLHIRANHSYGERRDFLNYSIGVINQHPHAYYLYHNLHNYISPNVPYYLKHSSAVDASHKTALDESLNPERYEIGIKHSDIGHQKTLDRIYGGRAGLKYDTPNSSARIYKAYTKGVDMNKRNRLNTYQKNLIHTYKFCIRGGYFGNDIFSNKRKHKYVTGLKKLTAKLHARITRATHLGTSRLHARTNSFSASRISSSSTYKGNSTKAKVVPHMQFKSQQQPRTKQLNLFKQLRMQR